MKIEDKIKLAGLRGYTVQRDDCEEKFHEIWNGKHHIGFLFDWNPTTNAEQFQELEDRFIEKYDIHYLGCDLYNSQIEGGGVLFGYVKIDTPQDTTYEGLGSTKFEASCNAMIQALTK